MLSSARRVCALQSSIVCVCNKDHVLCLKAVSTAGHPYRGSNTFPLTTCTESDYNYIHPPPPLDVLYHTEVQQVINTPCTCTGVRDRSCPAICHCHCHKTHYSGTPLNGHPSTADTCDITNNSESPDISPGLHLGFYQGGAK